ncbi:pyrroline-5-carboxylate reductase [Leuconostoc gelidum]|uniref:Pyrroline-5-carboxylate reductase n=1 Tax=Leuconostoc gelidum subsp. gelidum TaxID=1607839 RepID=A0AB35G121_LEUGE|nr:pyrroline-5-carboxylate reductase [Leuconostoc gelidum]AFS39805.1 pyrroline-5-carboxylate reductase [Leuconostoc gelidum JB7]MBZ5964673.1 pyrroline-5-carboxylate reductase [Leuconostoc gelidum subsp. gelidum]MBZ5974722.1 pyrroline-5-carboxylate reductase [Leuconostoc gelidum subsp. gelidum]MBZ5977562.1 pyrroline-5-carboxylate reductase [Leuconostoc gelidum subsp. gelidum]MBZ5986500.1 pyrroline-5-carboxylate reductase [Leuconostoc gelidum subsp. gelidum]
MIEYGFIGTGNMAQAMIKGLLGKGVSAKNIAVYSPRSAAKLTEKWGVISLSAQNLIDESSLIVLAFLPNQLENVTAKLDFQDKLVVSVLAGITLEQLISATHTTQIVRTLPNVNVAINQGVTAFSKTELTTTNNTLFKTFSDYLGSSVDLAESQFAIFSAVAGSGPAYVFKYIDALAQAGIANGLEAELATDIATQTVLGSAKTLALSTQTAKELQNAVTSPGGSTRAGLDDLDTQNFDDVIAHAIKATVEHKHL